MTALAKQIHKSGIRQNVIAKRLGVTPAAVCMQIKTGIRMVKTAKDYDKALNCKANLLLDL